MKHSRFGYSAVSCFEQCAYQYKCRYVDGLKTLPKDDAANPLIIGTALHKGVETDVDTAIQEYFNSFPIITDQHIDEEIKLRHMIPKVLEAIPEGTHEVKVVATNFIGTLDLLVPSVVELSGKSRICDACEDFHDDQYGDCPHAYSGYCALGKFTGVSNTDYDLYDFKYINPKNQSRYMSSRQLHLYKYYWEKTNPGKKIRNMYFVFIPKVQIRPKKTEDLFQYRQRLTEELKQVQIRVEPVTYDPQKVIDHLELTQQIMAATDFPKNPTRLCDFCEYQKYCQEGDMTEMLPSTNRVAVDFGQHKKIWIYGQPFTGKTLLTDAAPTPLNLNTDGNVKNVTMARLPIKDTMVGRQKKLAWEVFEDAITELEQGSDFETIVVDLLEDTYESCRLYMYQEMGITHESDDSFRAWDKVRTRFLSTIRRLTNLPYNIILISHEDMSKDITKRSGDKVTAIKPNIQDKIANKIAGMVDIVIRTIKDGNEYTLSTKTSDVIFGGGRLTSMKAVELPTNWESIDALYGTVAPVKVERVTPPEVTEVTEVTEPAEVIPADPQPQRRTRRTRA